MNTTTKPKPEVHDHSWDWLSAADAQARALVPPGYVWDEEFQQPVERGMALGRAQLERPIDLEAHLATYKRNRETLGHFIREYLEEAEYDKKTGALIPGRTNDYYSFPGSPKDGPKALTKRGAEKLAQLYRYAKAGTRVVDKTETAEYSGATVEVDLVDQYRRPAGSGAASCTTAESGFQTIGSRKKYGAQWDEQKREWKRSADYRAALNDLIARAGKRGYVSAVIYATGADEFFVVAREDEPTPAPSTSQGDEQPAPPASSPNGLRLPNVKALKQYAGKALAELPSDALARIAKALRDKAKHPAAWTPVLDAINAELDRRTQELRQDDNQEDLGL